MNYKILVTLMLIVCPTAIAQTADIPPLSGSGTGIATTRFIAAWYAPDGATIPAQATQYAPMFGDTAPRTAETDILVHATMYYNVTNFRLVSNTAGCGGLGVGEQFNFVFRKNQAATALTGTCLSTAAANSFTVDTDIVSIAPGDRLSISVASTATLLGRPLRVGISLEGFKDAAVNVTVQTDPVIDMTNEIFDAITAYIPLIIAAIFLFVGEMRNDNVYRAISGVFFLSFSLAGPFDTWWLRVIMLGAGLYLVLSYYFGKRKKNGSVQ